MTTTTETETLATLRNMPCSADGYVSLTTLRLELGHIERADLDAALFALMAAGQIRAIQNDNRAALSARDHEAALMLNGFPRHMVRVV